MEVRNLPTEEVTLASRARQPGHEAGRIALPSARRIDWFGKVFLLRQHSCLGETVVQALLAGESASRIDELAAAWAQR
jgi:hypothetical protein